MKEGIWEAFKRWFCRWYGHDWRADDRSEPVVPVFVVCVRCSKWSRLTEAPR